MQNPQPNKRGENSAVSRLTGKRVVLIVLIARSCSHSSFTVKDVAAARRGCESSLREAHRSHG